MENFYSSKKNKNMFITLIISLLLILSTLAYVIFIWQSGSENVIQNNDDVPLVEISSNDEVKNNAVQEGPLNNKPINNNSNSEDDFCFTVNKKITFKNSKSLGDIKIENPSTNKYNFYVEIKLKDEDKLLYKSSVLKPNQHIKEDYLITKLNKGKYNCVATIFVILPNDDNEVLTQSDMDIEIKVKQNI